MPGEIGSNFYYLPPYQLPSRSNLTKPPIVEIFPPKETLLKIIQRLQKEIEEIKAGFEDQKILENIPLTDNNSSYGNGDYIRPGEKFNRFKKTPVIIPAKDPKKTRLPELEAKQKELEWHQRALKDVSFLKEIESLTPQQLDERRKNIINRLNYIKDIEKPNTSEEIRIIKIKLEKKEKSIFYGFQTFFFKDPLKIRLKHLEDSCNKSTEEYRNLGHQLYLLDIQHKYKTKSFSPQRTRIQD